jgi:hypothetical protein
MQSRTKSNFVFDFGFPGLLGQQLFMGKLGYCSDRLVFQRDTCVGEMKDVGRPRIWVNPQNNFGISFLCIHATYFLSLHPCNLTVPRS